MLGVIDKTIRVRLSFMIRAIPKPFGKVVAVACPKKSGGSNKMQSYMNLCF